MSPLPAPTFLNRLTPPHITTLILLGGLGALSMNVFLPSLPAMADYFGVDYRTIQLSVALYLVMAAIGQVILGPVSDRYGRRPVMLWSIILFMIATAGCLLAREAWVFLWFRMAQAVIVAGFVLSRAAVRDMVPGNQAASMIGYVTMGMSLVPMAAPMLGGALGQAFGWQANFWLLLAGGAVVLWLTWSDMGETFTRQEGGFAAQLREYPELLMSRRFWGYCLAAAFASGSFFAYLGGAPYVGSALYNLSPAKLGFYFGAPSLGYLVGNFISGRFSVRLGINRMLLLGTILPTLGLLLSLAFFSSGAGSAEVFFGFMTIIGLGNGMTMPNATAGMLSVRPKLAGSASGLGGAIMIGAGAVLSAYAGTLLGTEAGALPLLWLMFICAALSVLCVLWVIRRDRAFPTG